MKNNPHCLHNVRAWLVLVMLSVLISSSFLSIRTSAAQAVIDATPYLNPTKPDYGIQQALDDAAAMGGATVQLPAGTFTLETYLQLKNGVTLKGMGSSTVLQTGRNDSRILITTNYAGGTTKTIAVADVSPLKVGMTVYVWRSTDLKFNPDDFDIMAIDSTNNTITLNKNVPYPLKANISQVSYGLYTRLTQDMPGRDTVVNTITVADPTFVKVGEAIMIKSDNNSADSFLNPAGGEGGWGVETNIVTAIDAASKTITLKNDIVVNARAGTVVFHAYGAVFAQGVRGSVRVSNIGLSDLVIQGWNTPNKPPFHEFYIGGVNFVYCESATISNVTVRYWHSDGISIQTCTNTTVADSSAIENRGQGFHPGTGSTYVEFVRLKAFGNLGFAARGTAGDGLYYCWSNQYVNIRQSVFNDNAGAGVGDVGGGDTNDTARDTNNIIEDNTMERNGRAGVDITGGGTQANTIIRRNTVRDNNRLGGSYAGIQISAKKGDAHRFTVDSNLVESTSNPATQLIGIQESNFNNYTANYNTITNNIVRNHSQGNILTIGPNTVVSGNTTGNQPAATPTVATPPTATATTLPTATTTAVATATNVVTTPTATSVGSPTVPTPTTAPTVIWKYTIRLPLVIR